MKVLLILIALASSSAFAQAAKAGLAAGAIGGMVGQGAKAGCNPSEWTCDSACQARKAKACGLSLSEDRIVVDKSRATASGGGRGKKKVGRQ